MTAKEMFEKLRYKQIENLTRFIVYHKFVNFDMGDLGSESFISITFHKDENVMTVSTDNSRGVVGFDDKELKAINKQAEELGW